VLVQERENVSGSGKRWSTLHAVFTCMCRCTNKPYRTMRYSRSFPSPSLHSLGIFPSIRKCKISWHNLLSRNRPMMKKTDVNSFEMHSVHQVAS
jgi:hypothetical protein